MKIQGISVLTLTIKAQGNVINLRALSFDGSQVFTKNKKVLGIVSGGGYYHNSVVPVVVLGSAVMEAGGKISIGEPLTTDKKGRAVVCKKSQENTFAYSLGKTSKKGELVEVLLDR